MKFNKNNNYATIAIYAFITIVLSAFVIVGGIMNMDFAKYMGILAPFFYAFAIAYVLNKVSGFFTRVIGFIAEKLFRMKKEKISVKTIKYISIALSYVVSLTALYGFVSVIIPQLTSSVRDVMNNYQKYIDAGSAWFDGFIQRYEFIQGFFVAEEFEENVIALINYLISFLRDLSPRFLNFLEEFALEVKNILIGLFISIYMLVGKERFKAQTKKLLAAFTSGETYEKVLSVAYESDYRFGGFIVGKIIDSTIIGIICYFSCLIFGFPFPALVSFIIGVTNIIPIAGPFIGAIPTGLLILLVDPTKFLWFILFILVLQQLDGNFIGPKILGDTTGLSSFWVLTSLVIMGGLYGIVGMLLAVPLFSVIYYEIKHFAEKRLSAKELSTSTADYASPEDLPFVGDDKPEKKQGRIGARIKEKISDLKKKNNK